MNIETSYQQALSLLKRLIETPSFSREEDRTALLIAQYLRDRGIAFQRCGNNVFAENLHFDETLETILLNSHHDTVKPNAGYTKDPFRPIIKEGKLYGLGSNDAGGCLVSLMAVFSLFYDKRLPFNLILAATAEEENSGEGGIASILGHLGELTYGIVGEPTQMKIAVAEKGLMVLDCLAEGVSGHAARDVGTNAIYTAISDIEKLKNFKFPKTSALLGPVKISTTQIKAGYQHNIIPDRCEFVVDVRTTDAYSNEEVLAILKKAMTGSVNARSTGLRPSFMPQNTPVFEAARNLSVPTFGSATTSDQAVIPVPTIKMGPGKSERSHIPDEFIYLQEIEEGIKGYVRFINEIINIYQRKRK